MLLRSEKQARSTHVSLFNLHQPTLKTNSAPPVDNALVCSSRAVSTNRASRPAYRGLHSSVLQLTVSTFRGERCVIPGTNSANPVTNSVILVTNTAQGKHFCCERCVIPVSKTAQVEPKSGRVEAHTGVPLLVQAAAVRRAAGAKHSSTFRLHVSTFCGIR